MGPHFHFGKAAILKGALPFRAPCHIKGIGNKTGVMIFVP